MALSLDHVYKILPSEIDGWKKTDKPVTYTKDSLYDYINGGAELYISYNFEKLLAVKYEAGENSEIIVDFFDMGSSYDAFGIFSYGREDEDKRVGQGSEYNSGLLTFWKDHYYVSILAYPETEKKKQIVLKLGQLLAEAIPKSGTLPPILSRLPKDNLIPESIRYLHHYVVLNNHYFIANENILQIDNNTQTALAKYKIDDDNFYLLLLLYPNNQKAHKAYESFLKHSLPDAQEGMINLSDGKWTGCRQRDNLLVIVFRSPTKDVLTSYLQLVMKDRS